MVWKLVKEFSGVWFVSANEFETPGSERIPSVFTIEQDGESDYKIVFCPTESDVPTLCRALGIYIDEDGKRHLALSDEIKPFRSGSKRLRNRPAVLKMKIKVLQLLLLPLHLYRKVMDIKVKVILKQNNVDVVPSISCSQVQLCVSCWFYSAIHSCVFRKFQLHKEIKLKLRFLT
ncbi:Kunitz type trypsin inhibitor / miraculin [Quillaja saponaria]|uniref:Kunitz type trypsin inhibitor / miraculin n=1 Tax=Quillaja saponaria TaxID=32244 RepID=A0AAD7Q5T4_QUISA|nr:Kunitz type trypsin inhibitor / miraculin [Quillaja saponaria]